MSDINATCDRVEENNFPSGDCDCKACTDLHAVIAFARKAEARCERLAGALRAIGERDDDGFMFNSAVACRQIARAALEESES